MPVVGSGLALMSGTMLTSALGLVFWVVAANLYDLADFGVASTSVYVMMILADMASLGLRSGLVRFLPRVNSGVTRMIGWAYGLAVASSCLAGIVFLAGLDWWAPDLEELGGSGRTFGFFALSTAFWAVFILQDAVLVAIRKAAWVPIENGFFGLAKIALLFPFAAWSPTLGIFWAWTLPVIPIVVAVNMLIIRVVRRGGWRRGDAGSEQPSGAQPAGNQAISTRRTAGSTGRTEGSIAALLRYSLADWLASVSRLGALIIIPLLVLATVGKEQAGYFQAAWLIGYTVFSLSTNVADALLAESSHEQHRLARHTSHARQLSIGLSVVIAVVGLAGAPVILNVFGQDFAEPGSWLLRLLLIAAVPNAAYQIAIGRFRSLDRMRRVVALETLLSVLAVGLSWLLLPSLGLEGVGVAWLVALAVVSIVALVVGPGGQEPAVEEYPTSDLGSGSDTGEGGRPLQPARRQATAGSEHQ